MGNKLTRYLSQPAPVNDRPWLTVMLITIIVVLILSVFEPFGFNGQMSVLLWFALATVVCVTLVFAIFPKIFKRFYTAERWTVGKTLLSYLMLIVLMGLSVTSLNYFVFMSPPPENYLPIFLTDMFASLTIGMIPLCIITFIIQNRALKRNLHEAKEMNKALAGRVKPDMTEEEVITLAGSTRESVTARPEDILFMEATGNYVNVHYKQDNKVGYKLLRTTIKQVEEALQDQPLFVRCHRTFIVNTQMIYNVTGNAQGYKLSLHDTPEEIPVSRTYLKFLRDILR